MALDPQHEHAVAAAGPLIGQGLGPGAVLPRLLNDDLNLVLAGDLLHSEVGHVDISLGRLGVLGLVLNHLDLILEVGIIVQQVLDLLVVYFQKRSL